MGNEMIESVREWTEPRVAEVPIRIPISGEENPVQLVVTEASVLQRDIAVDFLVDVAKSAVDMLSNLYASDDLDTDGLVSKVLGDDGGLKAQMLGVVQDVLGGKLTDIVMTILANRPNLEALGYVEPNQPVTKELVDRFVQQVRADIPLKAEPKILQAFIEVEDLGSLLGNWRRLWTTVENAVRSKETKTETESART